MGLLDMHFELDDLKLRSNMSETHSENDKEKELKLEDDPKPEIEEETQQEEERIKKKYGGLLRKKHPLISKDHDHAFFDSADWALGKQGAQKSKGPLEELRPKLQPTPHQQVRLRRSAYVPSDDSEGDGHGDCSPSEDGQEKAQDGSTDSDDHPEGVPKKEDDHPEDKNSQS